MIGVTRSTKVRGKLRLAVRGDGARSEAMNWLTLMKLGYVAFFLALSAVAYALIDPASVAPVAFVAHPVNATVVQPDDTARLRTLARRGDAQAEYQLGRAYATGRGVALDAATAAAWYAKAAAQGNAAAQAELGWAYYIGAGVPRSVASAQHWLALAAAHGDAQAATRLVVVERSLAPGELAEAYHR
jgi:TPR repeat protein